MLFVGCLIMVFVAAGFHYYCTLFVVNSCCCLLVLSLWVGAVIVCQCGLVLLVPVPLFVIGCWSSLLPSAGHCGCRLIFVVCCCSLIVADCCFFRLLLVAIACWCCCWSLFWCLLFVVCCLFFAVRRSWFRADLVEVCCSWLVFKLLSLLGVIGPCCFIAAVCIAGVVDC